MAKPKVLFLCVHNSARSQMAEAYLKAIAGGLFDAESAGLESGILNPFAVEVMKLDGIDISKNSTKDVFEMFKEGKTFTHVITVCDAGNADKCPVFTGISKKIAWDFPDPSKFLGTYDEKLAQTVDLRDKIKAAVQRFIGDMAKD